MPGTDRRFKPLKQLGQFSDLSDVATAGAAAGDLLTFVSGEWVNSKSLTGDYDITGALTATDLTLTDDLIVGDDLTVAGLATIGETLAVTGDTTLSGAAILESTLDLTGAATFADSLAVAGAFTGAGFSFSGNGTIGGTLGVTGDVTLSADIAAVNADFSGAVTVANGIAVTGGALFNDGLVVDDTLSAQALAAVNVSATGTLDAQGAATLQSGLTLSGGDFIFKRAVDTDILLDLQEASTSVVKLLWDASADQFELQTLQDSATLSIKGTNSASSLIDMLSFNPDGNVRSHLGLTIDGDIDHDGSGVGFFGTAPAAQASAYTPTNVTTDRSYDANATTLDEVADVLGTLIADLQSYGLLQ